MYDKLTMYDRLAMNDRLTMYDILTMYNRQTMYDKLPFELGDYDPGIHVGNYVAEMRLLELHREPVEGTPGGGGGVKGMSTQEAERTFLKIGCQLDTYGVDPHPVKKKHTVGFKCPNGAACRHVWCCAIEQMLFFTEILERDGLLAPREDPGSTTGKRKASSVPATPSTPMTGDFGYSSLPRSTHSAPLDDGGMGGECNGGCLLSGPAVDIALACCDPLRALPEEHKHDGGKCNGDMGIGSKFNGGSLQSGPAVDIMLAHSCAAPEYSQRDSFEHSSSESGVTSHTHAGAEEWRAPPPALQPPPRPFSLLRAFVPSFIFVWVSLGLVALLVFETDWVIFSALKQKPELISLRRHYYVPLKEYLKRKIMTTICLGD
ncbi:Band 4.1 [Operophtera brumata]|uniref:Band 4.1 n=1 Tax=Operophtera brumata TaxID=104452 RepID=A0A0L7LIQ9_OPEBR|nr:Band 4.1 [Operophtera brumata]